MRALIVAMAATVTLGFNSAIAQSTDRTNSQNGQAETESPFGVTIGLRAFYNHASGYGYGQGGIPGADRFGVHSSSDYATTFLPSVSLRYGDWLLMGGYHASTDYDANLAEFGARTKFSRREWDTSVGYRLTQGVIVSLGWKDLKLTSDFQGAYRQAYSGPFVGLAAFAPVNERWSVFGTFSYGRLDLEIDGMKAGNPGGYLASEVGMLYSLPRFSSAIKDASLMIGYRTQSVRTKDVPMSSFSIAGGPRMVNAARNVKDSIDGITIGILMSF